MNEIIPNPRNWRTFFRRAKFLSPLDLLQRAAVIVVIFLVVHLIGLREYTSVLNGTVGSVAAGWEISSWLALIYIASYLGLVVLAPILVLAAGMLGIWERFWGREEIRLKAKG